VALNFTSKDEYGLRAVIYLAGHETDWPVQTREIASNEHIPEQFLEQVLAALRRAGIVRSIRGAGGGYELARAARIITAGDVLRALSGHIVHIPDLDDNLSTEGEQRSVVVGLWERIRSAVVHIVDSTTIQDLVDEKNRQDQNGFFAMNI
jgi:Rrf2 family protein